MLRTLALGLAAATVFATSAPTEASAGYRHVRGHHGHSHHYGYRYKSVRHYRFVRRYWRARFVTYRYSPCWRTYRTCCSSCG